MHLIGIFTLAMTTWDWIKDRWSYINKTIESCYATTSSHLGFLGCRERVQVCSINWLHQLTRPSSTASARPRLIVRTLLQLCSVWEEVASFLKHMETKRKWAVCSSLVIVVSVSVPPAEWQLLLTSYAAQSPGPLRVPWPCGIQRGETGAVKTYTSPWSRGEFSSSCCPTGLCCALLLISSISSLEGPRVDVGPLSHLCYLVHLWSPA